MRYMVHNTMKQAPNAQVFALFSAEQARVGELLQQGTLETLYVGADFADAWLVFKGDSAEAVQQAAQSLPLYRFVSTEIRPLFEG